MAGVFDKASKVKDEIAALKTLIFDYPALTQIAALLNADNVSFSCSIDFIALLLWLIGVSKEDMLNWFAGLLSDKNESGFLNGLEYVIKGVLTANVKGLFTCSMNPFLTDEMINDGIELDVRTLDPFNVLARCPLDKSGSCFYFDATDSIFNKKGDSGNGHTLNELWKSCDFDAYLWYIINKATKNEQDLRNYWDNRNKKSVFKALKADETLRNKFFDITNKENKELLNPTSTEYASTKKDTITTSNKSKNGSVNIDNKVEKRVILYTQFEERKSRQKTPSTKYWGTSTNVIVVRPARQRYYHTWNIDFNYGPNIKYSASFNRTVFEFNYDYIWSLKLFDSKTIVTNLINSFMGLATVNLGISIEEQVMQAKVGEIVKQIVRSEDTTIDDCYYKFSNIDFDNLLKKSEEMLKAGGSSQTLDNLYATLGSISTAPTLQSQQSIISGLLNTYAGTTGENGYVEEKVKIKGGLDIIYSLFENTITQIVMQILTPKVILLYMVNMKIMGNIDPEQIYKDTQTMDINQVVQCLSNVIATSVQQLKDIFVTALFKWLMQQLKPLIALFASRIVLESIKDYLNVIEELIRNCLFWMQDTNGNIYAIDNVQYADIVPRQNKPKSDEC